MSSNSHPIEESEPCCGRFGNRDTVVDLYRGPSPNIPPSFQLPSIYAEDDLLQPVTAAQNKRYEETFT